MADVVDFLVLKQNYDIAMDRKWKPGRNCTLLVHVYMANSQNCCVRYWGDSSTGVNTLHVDSS